MECSHRGADAWGENIFNIFPKYLEYLAHTLFPVKCSGFYPRLLWKAAHSPTSPSHQTGESFSQSHTLRWIFALNISIQPLTCKYGPWAHGGVFFPNAMTTDCNRMNGGTDHLWRYDGLSENLTGSRMFRHWYRVRSSGTRIFTQTNKSVTILAPNHYTTTTTTWAPMPPPRLPQQQHHYPKNRERWRCLHMIQVFGRIL